MAEANAQTVKPTLGRRLSLVLIPLVVGPSIILLLLALIRIQSRLRQISYETGIAVANAQAETFSGILERQLSRLERSAVNAEFLSKVEAFVSATEDQASRDDLLLYMQNLESEASDSELSALSLARASDGMVLLATDPAHSGESLRVEENGSADLKRGFILDRSLDSPSSSPLLGVFLELSLQQVQEDEILLVSQLSSDMSANLASTMVHQAAAASSFFSHDGRSFVIFPPDLIYQAESEGGFVLKNTLTDHPALVGTIVDSRTYTFEDASGLKRIGVIVPALDGRVFFVNERRDVTLLESLADFLPVLLLVFFTLGLISSYIIYQSTNRTLKPLVDLSEFATRVSKGEWDYRVDENQEDELGQLATSLNRMAEELGTLYQSLEDQVEERTKQIRTASEVARGVISIPNLDELLRQAVQLIKDRFGYDHVSIFLLDNDGTNAILRETTTRGDEGLKTIGHRLPVGSPSVVGQVTESNQPRLASGSDGSQNFVLDELLPGARSEVAIPLQITGKSLGALAIQSYDQDAFHKEDIQVLQTLADQLSAAIENARLAQVSTNAAERARLVSEITGQISGLMDPEHVLRTTAQALHKALGDAEVEVRLAKQQEPSFDDGQ